MTKRLTAFRCACILAVAVGITQAAVEQRDLYVAQAKQAQAELTVYKSSLESCQDLLTKRGNEIAQCVDDNEEIANRLAQGVRCSRR